MSDWNLKDDREWSMDVEKIDQNALWSVGRIDVESTERRYYKSMTAAVRWMKDRIPPICRDRHEMHSWDRWIYCRGWRWRLLNSGYPVAENLMGSMTESHSATVHSALCRRITLWSTTRAKCCRCDGAVSADMRRWDVAENEGPNMYIICQRCADEESAADYAAEQHYADEASRRLEQYNEARAHQD